MNSPREKAEALANKFCNDFTSDDSLWHKDSAEIIAQTIEPILKELEAMQAVVAVARMVQLQNPDARMHHQLKRLDAIRKLNEGNGI